MKTTLSVPQQAKKIIHSAGVSGIRGIFYDSRKADAKGKIVRAKLYSGADVPSKEKMLEVIRLLNQIPGVIAAGHTSTHKQNYSRRRSERARYFTGFTVHYYQSK